MPKLKTHQATVKRIRFTKKGKMIQRKAGQNHFNARESGNITRNKRRDVSLSESFRERIKQAIPHN